jgi:nitrogen fixation NifU-like protein
LAPNPEIVLDHYENPRNVGEIPDADAVGIVENAACGDVMQLYLSIESETVVKATFKAYGCAPAIAAGSVLTELLTGVDVQRARELGKEDVASALGGLPPMKQHCSILAADALNAAFGHYESKHRDNSPATT